jgi:hypothetical protein
MQIACEQRRMFSKNPTSIKMDNFKLKFSKRNEKVNAQSQEQQQEIIKKRWLNRMARPVTVIKDGVKQEEKIIPVWLRQKQENEKQLEQQRKTVNKRKNNSPSTPTSLQDVTDGNGTGARGTDGQNDGRRIPLRKNARRRKGEDGK